MPPFSPALLQSILERLPQGSGYRVAYSGGCDSTVLLHSLASLRETLGVPVSAIHVDHQWHAKSAEWAAFCVDVCARLHIPCLSVRVDARPLAGESREAAARRARYAALAEALAPGEILLTAHHQDDQAETLLLQLLRGGGPRGLAAMPESAPFAQGHLARPLLCVTRTALCAYAQERGLAWIDDPSNFDIAFDRNFMRREILPRLEARWPKAPQIIARGARLQWESAQLLDDLAALDVAAVSASPSGPLSISRLRELTLPRQRNLLRYAVRRRGLPVPGHALLERILTEVLQAREDGEPLVTWQGAEARRYRDGLYLMPAHKTPSRDWHSPWSGDSPLPLPQAGILTAVPEKGRGLVVRGTMEVRFRSGGERCRPVGREETHVLKKLLQEAGVPPWERERLPLIYVEGALAAVADLWVCHPFGAETHESGFVLHWDRSAIEK